MAGKEPIKIDDPVKRGDFVSVIGDNFPDDAEVEFVRGGHVVTVPPALVRPYWLLIDALPLGVRLGENEVRVCNKAGWSSETILVDVLGTNPAATRILFPGRPKPKPYTIAFVANPAIRKVDATIVADPVLTNRPAFVQAVISCLTSYLTLDEDLFRRKDLERLIRFVAVFDAGACVNDRNALVEEYKNFYYMNPGRVAASRFLSGGYGIDADVIVVIQGSTTHTGSTSPGTTDDMNGPTVTVQMDGTQRTHGCFATVPGATALSIYDHRAPLPLHEFGHAASEYETAFVIDAYTDKGDETKMINKKRRAKPADPIPAEFCNYDGKRYDANLTRAPLTYPAAWTSYLPASVTSGEINIMDNFPLATPPEECRFDTFTREWLFARLSAKANR